MGCSWWTPPGTFAVITVNDTGSGMTPDTLAHVFEPFFTTKPPGEGTGLGLATVFGIIRQPGGQIDVESTPQRGTTFRILLPAAEPEPRAA
jgi:two-component system, cell cycle sensor histidine kinase and response regulator CckA